MQEGNHELTIVRASVTEDYESSATLLSSNEPWITLGRDYEYSLNKVYDTRDQLYVAKRDGIVLGCILIELYGQLKGFVRSICVDEKARGQGIGSLLLDFAEKLIFREHPNVFIFAASFNHGAKKLYLRQGYQEIGLFKDYILPGYDEILMRKTIGPVNPFEESKSKSKAK